MAKQKVSLTQADVKERTNSCHLTRYEMETTINFNEEEKEAYIYTYNKALIKKLDKYCLDFPKEYKLVREDKYGKHISKTYSIPKKRISFRGKSTRVMSEEQKIKCSERMKKIHNKNI